MTKVTYGDNFILAYNSRGRVYNTGKTWHIVVRGRNWEITSVRETTGSGAGYKLSTLTPVLNMLSLHGSVIWRISSLPNQCHLLVTKYSNTHPNGGRFSFNSALCFFRQSLSLKLALTDSARLTEQIFFSSRSWNNWYVSPCLAFTQVRGITKHMRIQLTK